MSDIPDDDLFLLLAHRDRRRVVRALLDGTTAVPVAEFLESDDAQGRERAEFERHVEMLERADVVRYDRADRTIARGSSFDAIASLVRVISRARPLDSSSVDQDPFDLVSRALQRNLLDRLHDLHDDLTQVRMDGSGLTDEKHAAIRREIDDLIRHVETVQAFVDTAVARDADRQEPVALREVLERQVRELQRWWNDSSIDVETIPDVTVEADRRLPIVFKNLLGHATAHTDTSHTDVRITGRQRNGEVTVVVVYASPSGRSEYGGPVVPESDAATARSDTKFDLYFAEQLLDAYDGELTVADRDAARTEFRVSLPCLDD